MYEVGTASTSCADVMQTNFNIANQVYMSFKQEHRFPKKYPSAQRSVYLSLFPFGLNLNENVLNDLEDEGQGQPLTIPYKAYTRCYFGANLVNLG